MMHVISGFHSEIEGSFVFCALMLFLCSILCLIFQKDIVCTRLECYRYL